jgi:hypothetical protein
MTPGPQASDTKSILRDAIQKAMAEITYHEHEAQKHLKQAEALRKELRETFALFQQPGGKKEASKKAEESPASRTAEPAATSQPAAALAAPKARKADIKKKHAVRRSKPR